MIINTVSTLIEQYQPYPLVKDLASLQNASHEASIPEEDVQLIALNCSGIRAEGVGFTRGRFTVTMPSGRSYFLALTITPQPLSPFRHSEHRLSLNDTAFASASSIENDTCTDSYWRGAKTHLTLNSNSRSNCRGCKFCGTYSLKDIDRALNTPSALRRKAEMLCEERGSDLSGLKSTGVVTGCFPNEESVVEHLSMIRSTFAEFGFQGELRYIGSQLRSEQSIKSMLSQGPFALYLTVEAFDRREQLMKKLKASLNLGKGRQVLEMAKGLGANTSFLYIAGLDSLETMQEEFPKYATVVTRAPLVQTFQVYVPNQILWRNPSAANLDYFLKARHIVEHSFPTQIPEASSNYRSLWYTAYKDQKLPNRPI